MRSFNKALVLALTVALVIGPVSSHQEPRHLVNNPFHDAHFWHAMERILIHIRPEAVTEDGIDMTAIMPEATKGNGSAAANPPPHGYMHVVFKEAEDDIRRNDGAGRIIIGIEPIQEAHWESQSTSLTFDLNSTKLDMNDVTILELAFSSHPGINAQPTDLGPVTVKSAANDIELMDVSINGQKPIQMSVRVRGDGGSYQTVAIPWRPSTENAMLNLHILRHSTTHAQMVRPLLVVYARLNQTRAAAEHPARRVRSAHLPPRTCKRCAFAERKRPLGAPVSAKDRHRNAHHYTCGLRQWYVTLTDLRWDMWVIAPSGFRMDYCSGPCQAPIGDSLYNATNHAIVRSVLIAGQLTDKMPDFPPPYCVPIKLRSTNIMYQESGQLVIKNLDNIIAEQCGCS